MDCKTLQKTFTVLFVQFTITHVALALACEGLLGVNVMVKVD